MPVHSVASILENVDGTLLALTAATFGLLYLVKTWSAGPKTTWEREWAGKMIMIVAPPSPIVLRLIDHLLRLPSPPQILYLPPYDSPLPSSLLTLLHTIRLSITNPLAQLHCEPLPQTPSGVREFTAKWGKVSTGMSGEGGRRIDALILASGWEFVAGSLFGDDLSSDGIPAETEKKTEKKETRWTLHEYHFHILTSLLPALLRQPPERNIRIISLISPTYSAALPALEGKPQTLVTPVQVAGAKSITVLLLMRHFQRIFDLLSAAALKKVKEVPGADGEVKKKAEEGVQSNVMVLRVVMPWTSEEVLWGSDPSDRFWRRVLRVIFLRPLLMLITPSTGSAIQPVLFALQAPVRYGPLDTAEPSPVASKCTEKDKAAGSDNKEAHHPRTAAVGNGDMIRYCQVIDSPPALEDLANAKAIYDTLEKRVEQVIKREAQRDKSTSKKNN